MSDKQTNTQANIQKILRLDTFVYQTYTVLKQYQVSTKTALQSAITHKHTKYLTHYIKTRICIEQEHQHTRNCTYMSK